LNIEPFWFILAIAIGFEGADYHVMARGNRRESIYREYSGANLVSGMQWLQNSLYGLV
jgi:hypothetical protein